MIRRALYITLLIALCLGFLGCATTDKGAAQKTGVEPATLTGVALSDFTLELHLSGPYSPSFTIYKPSDPYTVVVDLPDVVLGGVEDKIVSSNEGISEVRLEQGEGETMATRVEVLLTAPGNLDSQYSEGVIILTVAGSEMQEEPVEAAAETEMAEEEEAEAPMAPATQINEVGFDYDDGYKRLLIMGDGAMEPEVYTLDGKIIIDIPGVEMKAKLPDKVVAPVKAIRQGMYEGRLRFIVDLKEKVAFVTSTEGDMVTIAFPVPEEEVEVSEEMPKEMTAAMEEDVSQEEMAEAEEKAPTNGKPMAEKPAAAQPRAAAQARAAAPTQASVSGEQYSGRKISLDFQDAEIKPIVRLLAGDIGGYNVVLHPSVTGTINLRLKDVPWDRALDIILKQNNLGRLSEGNIMWVAPNAVFRQQEEEEAKRKQTYEKVADLVQEIIHLDHIGAADMKTRIEEAKVTSPRGQIRIDSRTNTLIINDTAENIRRIKSEEIPYWDTPEHGTMQVLIEAKIVEVSTDYSRALGIRWGGTHTRTGQAGGPDSVTTTFGVNTPLASPATADGGVVNLNVLEVGSVSTVSVNLSIEALESVGKTRKLANPKVLTIDKQSANIKQGVQIPFSTIEDGTAKTEFQEAVLSLDVTPEIQPNGIIRLKVDAKNDTPVQVGGETGINNQQISTQALVKDTETLVLGGIYTNTETEAETRVPLLGRIPVLGWLFKTRTKSNSPKELLIFITPKIIR